MAGFVPAGAGLAAQKYAGLSGGSSRDRRRRIPGLGCANCGGRCGMAGLGCGCSGKKGLAGLGWGGFDEPAPLVSVGSFGGGGAPSSMASDVPGIDPRLVTASTWTADHKRSTGEWVNVNELTYEEFNQLGYGSDAGTSAPAGWVAHHRDGSGRWVDASGRTYEESLGGGGGSSGFTLSSLFAVPGQVTGAFGMTPAEAAQLALQFSGRAPAQPRPAASSWPSTTTLLLGGLGVGLVGFLLLRGRRGSSSGPVTVSVAPAPVRRENRARRARRARKFRHAATLGAISRRGNGRSRAEGRRRVVVYGKR